METPRRVFLISTDTKAVTAALVDMLPSAMRDFSKETLEEAKLSWYDAASTVFDEEGPGGMKWKSLAEWTKLERLELKGSGGALVPGFDVEHPILQRTGRFMRSIIGGSSHHVVQRSIGGGNSKLAIGSTDPRFVKLTRGGISEEGNRVPARPVTPPASELYLEENIGNVLRYIMRRYFGGSIQGA